MPRWSSKGNELFFVELVDRGSRTIPPGRMMLAQRTTGAISWSEPQPLFDLPRGEKAFVPASDGRSFYFQMPNPDGPAREINVVVNWLEELKRLVPTK
jgi:hypothetical protein